MTTWDPNQYLKFTDLRRRPALDLLKQVPAEDPASVYDLGCGAGNITRLLVKRWPTAAVTGVDSSADMLGKAQAGDGRDAITWQQADLATWTPDAPAGVIYSNATMQWLPDHQTLFPRLIAGLTPGGVLAVQMPRMTEAWTHRAQEETAQEGPWGDRLTPSSGKLTDNPPAFYYDLLTPLVSHLDIWQTEYLHLLEGENPITEWMKGTSLRPYLDRLQGDEEADFLARYSEKVAAHYPPRPDGRTLLPFRRLLLIAVR